MYNTGPTELILYLFSVFSLPCCVFCYAKYMTANRSLKCCVLLKSSSILLPIILAFCFIVLAYKNAIVHIFLLFVVWISQKKRRYFVKSVDIGVLPNSICFSFTPSEIAKKLYFYPTWCGHYFCSSRYYMKRDFYPPLLVIYVRRGVLNVEYRGEHRQAREGDVVLLDCTEPHYYHAENNLEFLYMHYEGSNAHAITQQIINLHGWLFKREGRDKEGRFVRDSRNEQVNILLQDMVYLYEHNHAESMFESSKRIYKLFEIFLTPTEQEQKEELPITAAVEYIRSNIGKPITLEDLAGVAQLSPYYFSHMFKRETGFAPMEYVINTRIEHAKSLLLRTTMPVADIAEEVGYSTTGSLTNVFVKKVGESPAQYRKSHKSLKR